MLEAKNIGFSYSKPVLKDLSFAVGHGELFSLLGPNGSGKSTLVKIIVGLLVPEKGTIEIDGRPLSSLPRRELAKTLGYVAQESAIRFPLTAMELVLQGRFAQGRLIGFESDHDIDAARWAMEVTETSEFAGRPVTQLSGGERQRVMLARALAIRPRILVLDEPVANLDIAHQIRMLDLIKRLSIEEGVTSIVVTHELNLAAEFATKVLLMKNGEGIDCGLPRDVMTREALQRVFETELLVDENPKSSAPRVTLIANKRTDSEDISKHP